MSQRLQLERDLLAVLAHGAGTADDAARQVRAVLAVERHRLTDVVDLGDSGDVQREPPVGVRDAGGNRSEAPSGLSGP